MKKLVTSIMASAMILGVSSCVDHNFEPPISYQQQIEEAFDAAFIKDFGFVHPQQDWGFGESTETKAALTRGVNANANQWFTGEGGATPVYEVDPNVIPAERNAVFTYVNQDKGNLKVVDQIDFTDYFVTQVWKGNKNELNGVKTPQSTSYPDQNGATTTVAGAATMDQLETQLANGTWEHINNFNNANNGNTVTDVNGNAIIEKMLMVNSGTNKFRYNNSQSSFKSEKYIIVKGSDVPGMPAECADYYYVCFDFEHGYGSEAEKKAEVTHMKITGSYHVASKSFESTTETVNVNLTNPENFEASENFIKNSGYFKVASDATISNINLTEVKTITGTYDLTTYEQVPTTTPVTVNLASVDWFSNDENFVRNSQNFTIPSGATISNINLSQTEAGAVTGTYDLTTYEQVPTTITVPVSVEAGSWFSNEENFVKNSGKFTIPSGATVSNVNLKEEVKVTGSFVVTTSGGESYDVTHNDENFQVNYYIPQSECTAEKALQILQKKYGESMNITNVNITNITFKGYGTGDKHFDGDNVYTDWIVRISPAKVKGDPGTQTEDTIPSYTVKTIRVYAEDLYTAAEQIESMGSTKSDYDYNDVVFDIVTTRTAAGALVSSKVIVQAAGGTLPLYLTYNSTPVEVHEALLGLGASTNVMINTGRGMNDVDPATVFSSTTTEIQAIDIVITCDHPKQKGVAISAKKGEPASKFAVDMSKVTFNKGYKGKNWPNEQSHITTVYTGFKTWVNEAGDLFDYANPMGN